jgi:hypothetical protein
MKLLKNIGQNELFINNHLMQIASNVDYLTMYNSQKLSSSKSSLCLLKIPFLESRKPKLMYILNVRTS